MEKHRCPLAGNDPLYIAYHDTEWGKPLHGDRPLFEMLSLEGMQAGLSWITVLRKRAALRAAFAGFDIPTVAAFGDGDIARCMGDPGIIRNRRKITSVIGNARCVLDIQREWGSFDAFIWHYTDGVPLVRHPATMADVPAATPLSDRISADLRARGFTFVGSVIVYSFMQAVGMVNDHLAACDFR